MYLKQIRKGIKLMKKVEPIRDKELIEEIKRLLMMDNYRNYLLLCSELILALELETCCN